MDHRFHQHYALLGINPGATWRDLKTAYRTQIKKWHPDRFHADPSARKQAEEHTKAINRAYNELSEYYRAHSALPLNVPEVRAENSLEKNPPYRPPVYSSDTSSTPDRSKFTFGISRWVALGGATVLAVLLFAKSNTPPDESTSQYLNTPLPNSKVHNTASSTNNSFFTYGSTMGEVYAAQGIPSSSEHDVWHYGTSRIYFHNGKVIRWEETTEHPLKARADLLPSKQLTTFSRGSTKIEVRSIQGNPVRENDKMWEYGVSRIYFDGDRVIDWYESPLDPLKIKR